MNTLYMMIGLPGSGKSTIAEALSKELGIPLISSDKVRLELTGSEENFDKEREVWGKVIPSKLNEALQVGDAIFDATNLRVRDRNKLSKTLIPHRKEAVFVNTSLEECIARQETRERKVPIERIEEMSRDLVVPTLKEGFSNVYMVEDGEALIKMMNIVDEKCRE